jgi:hypothetical protein
MGDHAQNAALSQLEMVYALGKVTVETTLGVERGLEAADTPFIATMQSRAFSIVPTVCPLHDTLLAVSQVIVVHDGFRYWGRIV